MRLIDTSVLIDSMRKGIFEKGVISVITLIEILRGISGEKRERVKRLIEDAYDIININNKVILKYCEIYEILKRKGGLMSDADMLIAATAMAHDLVLVTKDRDFERLVELGLKLELR